MNDIEIATEVKQRKNKIRKQLKEKLGEMIVIQVDYGLKSKDNSKKIQKLRGKIIAVNTDTFTIEHGKTRDKYKETFNFNNFIDGSVVLCIKI